MCRAAGFQYAGLQWKGQCFCGNDYGKYGVGDHWDCSQDSKEYAFWGNCVYDLKSSEESFASEGTTSPSTTVVTAPASEPSIVESASELSTVESASESSA